MVLNALVTFWIPETRGMTITDIENEVHFAQHRPMDIFKWPGLWRKEREEGVTDDDVLAKSESVTPIDVVPNKDVSA
jgi:hypothetical protein